MSKLIALLAGSLFGLGLTVSDMVNPARVLAFLDLAGNWDPTLAFVMGGALIPMAVAWRFRHGGKALNGADLPGPASRVIDARLVGGAAIFGLGWGLVGLCPGPALAILGFGGAKAVVFVAAMVAGMLLYAAVSGGNRFSQARTRNDGSSRGRTRPS